MSEKTCENCQFSDNLYLACLGCKADGMRGWRAKPLTDEEKARRAGKVEGKAEAFKEISDALLKRGAIEVTAGHRVAANVLTEIAAALLARAEEVER